MKNWKNGKCEECKWQGMLCVEGHCTYTPKPENCKHFHMKGGCYDLHAKWIPLQCVDCGKEFSKPSPKVEIPKPFMSSDHYDLVDVACKVGDIIKVIGQLSTKITEMENTKKEG